ncbi:MAG: S8 family peptidase [Bacteroidota bacterium]|nr:S8 family peptidase [Bacteroidota bacterium]
MILALLLSIFLSPNITPTPTQPVQRWLVEVNSNPACLQQWWQSNASDQEGFMMRKLPVDNWWVIQIPENSRTSLESIPCVIRILVDHKINYRNTTPNDPGYINQDDMDLIGMPKAWDIAKGGVTSRGDTIVVAVLDDGYETTHDDLKQNYWVNRFEIPGDGIDNDANGYIDDYLGLNVSTGNDAHAIKRHGTEVSGIIGARGNNNKGIAGVNWNVKLMALSGADFESELIEAYQYILEMRKNYRLSNGHQGAFVVATNLSGGVDFEFAIDHPLWCEMYDKLGDEGVLSIVAGPNNSISVDELGDMPSTCTSPYMIAVTNVDLQDVIVANAGFGPLSIDLGAPGHGSFSTRNMNDYGEFTGTSAAAPHVTGTVALMYSTPCASFLNGIDTDPKGIATKVRDIILSSARANNSLNDITRTGKRLQTDAAMAETLEGDCDETENSGVRILLAYPNPPEENQIQVDFEITGDTTGAFIELYTTTGALVEHYELDQTTFSEGLGSVQIKTVRLPPAIYLLTLRRGKEKDTVKLFLY